MTVIDALRTEPDADPGLLAQMVDIRHRAFRQNDLAEAPPFDPPEPVDPGLGDLTAVDPAQLDVATLRAGLARNGCVLVRGLIDSERARGLAGGIDRALEAFDRAAEDGVDRDEDGWYAQFQPQPGAYRTGGRRNWVRASGALWTADSPRMFAALLDLIRDTGVGELVTEYLGERPALSANKCTLRRVPLTTSTGWHQDGAFLGPEVRTLNLWLALGDCGTDAPGMDVVPRRIPQVLESGTEGATFDWSVAPAVVEREAGELGIRRPEFRAGDALLFDHLFLHSTAVEATMSRERHAMETWFFAPSSYPEGQIPIAY